MNELVKITRNEDGQKEKHAKWHLVVTGGGSAMAACTGEVFGFGEGSAQYQYKTQDSGGITCPGCLELIKFYKSIKL